MGYDGKDIDQRWESINIIANELMHQFGPKFTSTKSGHIQTDISAAGSISGLWILQETIDNLSERITVVKPGTVLLDDVQEGQNDIIRFLTEMYIGNGLFPRIKLIILL